MNANHYDSVEVLDADGEPEGFALVKRNRPYGRIHSPVQEIQTIQVGDARIVSEIYATRSGPWVEVR